MAREIAIGAYLPKEAIHSYLIVMYKGTFLERNLVQLFRSLIII
ncbi:hypothetical protein [Clostridium thailandense]